MAKKPKAQADNTAPETVTLNCLIEGGVVLRLFDMIQDDLGESRAVAVASFTLQRGPNPGIEAGFAQRWLDENAESDFVKNGLISLSEEGND